jgi:hypothetical protein
MRSIHRTSTRAPRSRESETSPSHLHYHRPPYHINPTQLCDERPGPIDIPRPLSGRAGRPERRTRPTAIRPIDPFGPNACPASTAGRRCAPPPARARHPRLRYGRRRPTPARDREPPASSVGRKSRRGGVVPPARSRYGWAAPRPPVPSLVGRYPRFAPHRVYGETGDCGGGGGDAWRAPCWAESPSR